MPYTIAALYAALILLILEQRRHDKHLHTLVNRLHHTISTERAAYLEHIENLYQRIQAPAEAVTEHAIRAAPPAPPALVGFDDDDAFWAAGESKDALADRALHEELEARKPIVGA